MSLVKINLKSQKMMTNVPVNILLPDPPMGGAAPADFYSSGEKYRVLWLLHGASGDGDGFLTGDGIMGKLRGKKTVCVMPSGINSDYANHMEFGTGFAFTDFFFEELMPFVYATFPASDDPMDNFIAGFSMGGAGSIMLGLLHPEKFGGIGGLGSSMRESEFLKPYLDLKGWEFRELAEKDRTALPTEFGDPKKGITLKEINMISRYDTVRDYVDSYECTIERFPEALATGHLPEMFFCCGDLDGCYEPTRRFVDYAHELGAEQVKLKVLPGLNHSAGEACIAEMIREFGL